MNSELIQVLLVLCLLGSSCVESKDPNVHKDRSSDYNRPIWPEPRPHEIEVMILGVYHMSNPHLDENNVNADDVRMEKRQRELFELTNRLAQYRPDMIAVEASYLQQGLLDSMYLHVPLDSILATYTNETFQIGFRLARELELPGVHAIDYRMRLGNDSLKALYDKYDGSIPHKIKYPLLDWEQINTRADSLLYNSTIREYLIEKNLERNHQRNHYGMFADLRIGEGENFGGARNLARWYERNFKMVHNVYRAATPDTKRILLIVGSGHVSPIRHILDDAPMFCPISPLPYLAE